MRADAPATSVSASVPASPGVYARRFVVNALYGVGGRLLQLAVSFFLIGYVVRVLGREQWGLVVIATTVVSFLSLIELGTSAGIAKKLNMFMTQGDSRRFRQHFTAGAFLCAVLASLMLLMLMGVLVFLWPRLNVAPDLSREGQFVLTAICFSAACSLLSLPSAACLQAVHRIDIHVRLSSIALLLRCGLVVTLFQLIAPRASIYSCVLIVANVFVFVAQAAWVHRYVPDARIVPRLLSTALLRDVVAFNALTVFNTVNYVIFMQAPAFVLQAKTDLGTTGLYGIALQLNNLVRGFLLAPTNALSPVAVHLEAAGKAAQLRQLFCVSTKAYGAVGIMMWVWFWVVGDSFLHLWLARDVGELARALPWLIGATAAGTMTMPAAVVVVALERLRVPGIGGMVMSVLMVGVMLTGFAVGEAHVLTRISIVLAVFFTGYQLLRFGIVVHAMRIPLRETVGDLLLRPALPALAAGLALWGAAHHGLTSTALQLGGSTAAAGVVFGTAVWFGVVGQAERTLARTLIGTNWSREERDHAGTGDGPGRAAAGRALGATSDG